MSDPTIYGTEDNDVLTGTAGDDILSGLGGNDTIDGGEGADQMLGGTGNDTFVVDNSGDTVSELLDEGTQDTVMSSVSFTLGANVEFLTLTGSLAIDGEGNELGNRLTG